MIILFGFRRRVARLGTIFMMCGLCHSPAAQALTRARRYFTVFFIPVIPLGTKYALTCTMCGRSSEISPEVAGRYVATAAAQAAPIPTDSSDLPAPPAIEAASSDQDPAAP
jgi:zinc-ribbon family